MVILAADFSRPHLGNGGPFGGGAILGDVSRGEFGLCVLLAICRRCCWLTMVATALGQNTVAALDSPTAADRLARAAPIEAAIGSRYVIRTQLIFLN